MKNGVVILILFLVILAVFFLYIRNNQNPNSLTPVVIPEIIGGDPDTWSPSSIPDPYPQPYPVPVPVPVPTHCGGFGCDPATWSPPQTNHNIGGDPSTWGPPPGYPGPIHVKPNIHPPGPIHVNPIHFSPKH